MNKAITDGLVLMPTPFAAGLDQWSSGDGTPGSATYQGAANAAFVPADQDFGGALELQKTDAVQKLRFMGETPLQPGCYLRIRVRIKAISGNLPSVRIAGWAGDAGGAHVAGLIETGPTIALTQPGEVVTISAIVGTGARAGVDMVWGLAPIFGHFGLDLTGPNGGVVRIDDVEIEDVTAVFHRKMMDWVDVRDYGALGDGVTDDRAAFLAADAAAAGRQVLVSAGVYRIADTLTVDSPVRFEGILTMPDAARLQLTRSFDFPTYAAAFGDEVLGLRKAVQALFNFTDHSILDLKGRRIQLTGPLDVHAAVGNIDSFAIRRGMANGQLDLEPGAGWNTVTVTSQATYAPAQRLQLSGVANVAQVPVGALVTGTGVGREVYVTARNVGAGTLTLSQPLHDAEGTQVFTFRRFQYALDFSGFSALSSFEITGVEFLCNGVGSAIMLAPDGLTFRLADCVISKPRDRGITSTGVGCQGILIDRCQFLSNEQPLPAQARSSIAFNVNANDAKVRNNRAVRFAHFGVLNGTGHMFVGNHFFQGDEEPAGVRVAGVVLTQTNVKTTFTGNYIDNSFIEWTNEHDEAPAMVNEFSFGGLTITGNLFTANGVAPWFRWLVIKPFGPDHFIQGLNVSGNVFRTINGPVDRVEQVDTTFANLDFARTRNLVVQGNAFNGVNQTIANPVVLRHDQVTAAATWTVQAAPFLPFGGFARTVEAIVAEGPVTGAAGEARGDMPFARVEQGAGRNLITLNWANPSKGRVNVTVRADSPI
jgi:hypothetical protein